MRRLDKLRLWRDRHMMHVTLACMIFGLLLVYFAPQIIITVPAGYRGVLWYRFGNGTDVGHSIPEGTSFKFPWDVVYRYDARLRVVTQTFDVITSDGLAVKTTISFRFRVNPSQLGNLHKNIGPNYVDVMLSPEIGSSARVLIARYTAEEFYTTARLKVQDEIMKQIRERLLLDSIYSPADIEFIWLDEVMIKDIQLPERVALSIERKVEQYQQNLEYDFRLMSEAKEAARKQIEGQGVRDMFNQIGHADLPNYLRLAGINATLQLANSPNAKVVVVGNAGVAGGLPLLLGSDIGSAPQPPAAAASGAKAAGSPGGTAPQAGPIGPMQPPARTQLAPITQRAVAAPAAQAPSSTPVR